ncbi:hypothetical protein GEMRC1_000079 [Eukaryota sp. GEM-RC1]
MTSTQISPASLCIKLLETSLKHDFSANFKDLQIPCHSVVLVQFSGFFHNLFTLNCSDDQETQDFSSLNVSSSSFRSFFSYLYAQPVEITLENLYEFYVLSRYFMVEDLKTTCLELLTTFSNSTDSLLFLVKQANHCQDQEFLKHLSEFINSDFIVPSLVDSFDLQKEEPQNQKHQLLPELKVENLTLNSEVEFLRDSNQKAKSEENERRRIEALIGTFDPTTCGSELSLSNNNNVVKKNGSRGDPNSFVEVNLSNNCSVKFTRLDDPVDDSSTDYVGWKDAGSLQDGTYPSPRVCSRGNCNGGSFSPSNPSFPTITKGESITVSFSNGKAYFKPSTCTTTFSIDIPSNLVFGMTVYGKNHEWKVERV